MSFSCFVHERSSKATHPYHCYVLRFLQKSPPPVTFVSSLSLIRVFDAATFCIRVFVSCLSCDVHAWKFGATGNSHFLRSSCLYTIQWIKFAISYVQLVRWSLLSIAETVLNYDILRPCCERLAMYQMLSRGSRARVYVGNYSKSLRLFITRQHPSISFPHSIGRLHRIHRPKIDPSRLRSIAAANNHAVWTAVLFVILSNSKC